MNSQASNPNNLAGVCLAVVPIALQVHVANYCLAMGLPISGEHAEPALAPVWPSST